ncbi:MAG: hypothetical protein ACM31L_07865 [Actinomycetota bacterium]
MTDRIEPNFEFKMIGRMLLVSFAEDTPTHADGDEFVVNVDHIVGFEQCLVEAPNGQSSEGVKTLTINPNFSPVFDLCDENGPTLLTVSMLMRWLGPSLARTGSGKAAKDDAALEHRRKGVAK